MIIITLIPVAIGMYIKHKVSWFVEKMNIPVKILSGLLFLLIIMAAILNNKDIFFASFGQAGPAALALNVIMLIIGFASARLFKLKMAQSVTISIESGIQNGTLGIAIAATLLYNPTMTISPAIYSLIMFVTGGLIIAWMNLAVKSGRVSA